MNKHFASLIVILTLCAKSCFGQSAAGSNDTQTTMGSSKADLAQPNFSLISGDYCTYMWHGEFNALFAMCHNSEGMVIGRQVRILQSPARECYVTNEIFMPIIKINDLARIFAQERSGSYYCCDVFEPGAGYVFTDCGGEQVVVVKEKINGASSQNYTNQQAIVGYSNPLWDWNQLKQLVDAKCNGTYSAIDEYTLGQYDLWLSLALPWQQWLMDANIRDIVGLKDWLLKYQNFLIEFVNTLNSTSNATVAFDQILQLFPENIQNATLQDLINNNAELLQQFGQWFQQVQYMVVNNEPGLSAIKPGYRAIVKWIKQRMVQEFYAQVTQVYANATASNNPQTS